MEIRGHEKNKMILFHRNQKMDIYFIVHETELERFAEKRAKDLELPLKMDKTEIAKVLNKPLEEIEIMWNKHLKRLSRSSIDHQQEELLTSYFLSLHSPKKVIGWFVNGYYEKVEDYYIFPSKEAYHNRLRNFLK